MTPSTFGVLHHLRIGRPVRRLREAGDLTGVLARNEVFRADVEEDDGSNESEPEGAQHDVLVVHAPLQRAHVQILGAIEGALAPVIEFAVFRAAAGLQETAAQHRRQSDRNDAGDRDGDHDRYGEFVQQPSHDAAHEDERDEHGRQRHGHRENRKADLGRARERGGVRLLAFLDMAHDVFEHHDGVVDDETDRERERHERKIVEAVAQERHACEGADDGDGQRQ